MVAVVQDDKPKRESLSRRVKLAYGAGDLNAAIAAALVGFYLNPFLYDVAGVRPALVGLIFLITKIWDAVTDPLVGDLADNTRTRFGAKRAWLLFGAIPFAITFFLLWIVPGVRESGLFWYYLLAVLAFRTAFTAVNVPYASLTPELTPNYDERTSLNSYRFSFSILGGVTAVALHPIIVGMAGDNTQLGYMMSASVWAVIIVISAWTAYAGTFEPVKPVSLATEKINLLDKIRMVFQNRPFLHVTGIYLMSWMAVQFVQVNLLLYVRYWLDAENIFIILVVLLQVTAFAFLGFWGWVAKRYSKNIVYAMGAVMWLLTMTFIYIIQPGQEYLLYFAAILAGIGTSVAYLMPWSMLPDTIEYQELKTGHRNEGVFYGYFVFLQKIGIALGIAISGLILDSAGYLQPVRIQNLPEAQITEIREAGDDFIGQQFVYADEELEIDVDCRVYNVDADVVNCNQPESVARMLRIFVSLLPAAILLLSIPIALTYPITRERFAEIEAELNQRRREADDTIS